MKINLDPSKYTILVTDDNPNNLAVIVEYLEDLKFEIATARDGDECLELLNYLKPDLILMDIIMPNLNGLDTCKILKENEKTKDIIVIFMTALTGEEETIKGFDVGGSDYITKPFKQKEVLARITTQLLVKEQERLLNKKNIELSESMELLRQKQQELVEARAMTAMKDVVIGIAHEINTPIGTGLTTISHLDNEINMLKELLDNNKISKQILINFIDNFCECSKIITHSFKVTANLINQFKKLKLTNQDFDRSTFILKTHLEEIFAIYNERLNINNHRIILKCSNDIKINSYHVAFYNIFSNLIENSLAHSFDNIKNGEILVNVIENSDSITIFYMDNGISVSPEYLEKVFNPFYTTKRGKGFLGLGLNIIYNLVTFLLNGKIELKNDANNNSFFEMTIPKTIY